MRANTQTQDRGEDLYPALPEGMTRGHVERVLVRTGRHIGLSANELSVLLLMVSETRPRDWTDPTTEPMCYSMQGNLARRIGVSERSIRRIEVALEEVHRFVSKDVGLSGRRYCLKRSDGSEFRQGISLTPLIEATPLLLGIDAELDQEIQERRELKLKISAGHKRVKNSIMSAQQQWPSSSTVESFTQAFLDWPRRFPASVGSTELRHHLEVVMDLVDKIELFFEKKQKESGHPDSGVLPLLQDTTHDLYVPCNDHVERSPACKQADTEIFAPPTGGENCFESNHEADSDASKSENLDWLTPDRLLALCTDEMQTSLVISQGEKPNQALRTSSTRGSTGWYRWGSTMTHIAKPCCKWASRQQQFA
ncbi:helix-turn-helix domain-containing protein [uncultured Ruegeria sp.]|uniref:helix-turn-helix domain-containing protein n=1 Tax=uncultured Ruegeria sp. TaxID=259304 RepID=UPI00262D74C0|nr:helix-turn-helix domain-containing protein [uncultured Ruegeria sp.]